jgi:hypothetical protein
LKSISSALGCSSPPGAFLKLILLSLRSEAGSAANISDKIKRLLFNDPQMVQ